MTSTTDMTRSPGKHRSIGAGDFRDEELDAVLGELELSKRNRHTESRSVFRKASSGLRALVHALLARSPWR